MNAQEIRSLHFLRFTVEIDNFSQQISWYLLNAHECTDHGHHNSCIGVAITRKWNNLPDYIFKIAFEVIIPMLSSQKEVIAEDKSMFYEAHLFCAVVVEALELFIFKKFSIILLLIRQLLVMWVG